MYTVESFYDDKLMGLENRETEIEDWDKVVDLSHEWVSNGGYVRITNDETGKNVVLDYDSYFDGFEGEFPVDMKDLEPNEAAIAIGYGEEGSERYTGKFFDRDEDPMLNYYDSFDETERE